MSFTNKISSIASVSPVKIVLTTSSSSLDHQINPFTATDEVISNHVIGIHDSQAPKYDVDSLYNVVSNIVKSSMHIGSSFDLKRPKAVELVEDKVPQSSFMPPFSTLKEIACQMTCKPFNKSMAHETVVGILEKLRSYTWDAKAVIALSAFALDLGENWRLSLMTEPTKENALELHIFRLGCEEAKHTKSNLDLIPITFKLIEGVSTLEKKISDKTLSSKDVPTLYAAPREFYTYWAILALLTCSNRMSELDDIKSEVVGKLNHVQMRLNNDLTLIKREEEEARDATWRRSVINSPSGIVNLLKALIFSLDITELEIFDNTTHQVVSNDVLKTKNLLLFFSGLDIIQEDFWVLRSIHEAFVKDKEKQNYQILWIPVVEETEISDDHQKENFKNVKSSMPWYVLQNLFVIKGKKVLEEELHYQGKPIVVVTNPRGELIHRNAMHMIFVWKIKAFPFTHEVEDKLSLYWNWFWIEVTTVHPEIGKWIQEDKYVFIYGGTDVAGTQRIGTLLDSIKKHPIITQTDTIIEHFNLSKLDQTSVSNFRVDINNLILSRVQNDNLEKDTVLKQMETLHSYVNDKTWALLSKGNNVLVLGYDPLITNVLEAFDEWSVNIRVLQGFDKAFMNCYDEKKDGVPPPCVHFQLSNIRSRVPFALTCPEPSCNKFMEVEVVSYNCCHGIHNRNQLASENNVNGEVIGTPLLKTKWTP